MKNRTSDANVAMAFAQLASVLGILVGAVIGGWLVWIHAPPVGGEWWPYVRAGAALVGAAVGSSVGSLFFALGGLGVGLVMAVVWS